MADLDATIAGELAAMQARGAGRQMIEERHRALCAWAIEECTKAGAANPIELLPASQSDELVTVRAMWANLLPQVTAAIRDGLTVECLAIARAEDGVSVIMCIDFLEPEDPMLWASADFYRHFDPSIWAEVLSSIAVDYDARVDVEDYYPQALADALEPPGPWRRVF